MYKIRTLELYSFVSSGIFPSDVPKFLSSKSETKCCMNFYFISVRELYKNSVYFSLLYFQITDYFNSYIPNGVTSQWINWDLTSEYNYTVEPENWWRKLG